VTSYPGPWIQAPDYEVEGAWAKDAPAELPIMSVSYLHDWSDGSGAAAMRDAMLSDVLEDVKNDLNTSPPIFTEGEAGDYIAGFGFLASGDRYVEYRNGIASVHEDGIDSGGPFGAFSVEHNVVGMARFEPLAASPYHQSINAWAPSILFPPPGAVGWEWADETPSDTAKASEVRAATAIVYPTKAGFTWTNGSTAEAIATLGTQLLPCPGVQYASDAGWVPDSSFTEQVVSWSGPFDGSAPTIDQAVAVPNADPTFKAWKTPVAGDLVDIDWTLPHSEAGQAEHHDPFAFDLAPYLDGQGRATFSTRVYLDEAEILVPPETAYGYRAQGLSVVWTFRPPVFRWLYATPQITSAPPLRHTQRDDNHGPSPRNRPTRSRQAGLRNTGYL